MAFWLAVGRWSAASAFGFDFMMIMIRLGEAFIKMVIFLINVFGFDFLINEKVDRNKVLRKLKMTIKVKIFICYLIKGVTLTKDNLAKRNWNGSTNCCFFMYNETI